MASIHAIPLRFDAAAGGRLTAQLAALVEAGVDLGPRYHQIAMIRASIVTSLRALPKALAAAVAPLAMDDACRREAEDAVQSFTEAVEELIRRTGPPLESAQTKPEALYHG